MKVVVRRSLGLDFRGSRIGRIGLAVTEEENVDGERRLVVKVVVGIYNLNWV